MEDIGIRLKQLLDEKKLSATEFSEQVGIQRSSLSHLFSGRNKPSIDLLLKVKKQFPETDLEWLITGISFKAKEIKPKISSIISDETGKTSVTNVNNDPYSPDNQINKSTIDSAAASTKENNEIERIIIFYNDGHFKEYKN